MHPNHITRKKITKRTFKIEFSISPQSSNRILKIGICTRILWPFLNVLWEAAAPEAAARCLGFNNGMIGTTRVAGEEGLQIGEGEGWGWRLGRGREIGEEVEVGEGL